MTDVAAPDQTKWRRPVTGPAVEARTIIHVDDVHPAIRPSVGASGAELTALTGDECDLALVLFRLPPNYVGVRHSHDADTVYIVRQGVFHVEGEGSFGVGDVRWVKAGTVYGPESAGPEGCEVYLVAAGKFPLATNRVG